MAFLLKSLAIGVLVTLLYAVSFWISLKRGSLDKLSPYESGFEPTHNAFIKFDILFWKIGLLYLIFDLELVLLFPYGSVVAHVHNFNKVTVFILFLKTITLAFLYEYITDGLTFHP